MLNEIALENFKPFGTKQIARLSNITLIYGPNSGGKSSLIQALMLLRQSIEGYEPQSSDLIARGEYIDLGSFKSLIHKHEVSRDLSIALAYDRPASSRRPRPPYYVPPRGTSRRVELRFRRARASSSRRMEMTELAGVNYSLNDGKALDAKLLRAEEPTGRIQPELGGLPGIRIFRWADDSAWRSFARLAAEAEDRRHLRRTESQADLLNVSGESSESPYYAELLAMLANSVVIARGLLPVRIDVSSNTGERTTSRWPSLLYRGSTPLEGLVWEFEDLIKSMSYLGPLRSYPARHYLLSGGVKQTVGVRGENTPQMIYRRAKEITASIDKWFKDFEIPYQLKIRQVGDAVTGEIIVLTLTDKRVKVPVAPSDVGFGIGQLLPIIVEGAVARNKILCVEQPEIHLHPRLQAHVADLLIETAGLVPPKDGARPTLRHSNQWIVETHSESLMLRLQRRIREQLIRPEDVSILYVEPGGANGSRIMQLRLDEHGEFVDEWPMGFFEERYAEVFGEEK